MEVVNETLATKMGGSDGDPMASQGVVCSYGAYGVYVVVLLFQFINWIIKSVGPPKSLRDDEWKWRNLFISWIHALVCIIWIFVSVARNPEMMLDLQYFKNYSIFFLIMFSTGYFLYDFLDLALNGKMLAMWEVQLHHVAVGGIFYYNLVCCEWLSFNIIALSVEVNSFFLHSRKLLQMINWSYQSRFYRLVKFLNISTFVVFRGIPLVAISWAMVNWYHRVTLTYYLSLGGSMFVMVTMNPILFMRLLRSDYLRKGSSPSSRKSDKSSLCKTGLNGNNNHIESNGVNHLKSS
ncbi:TLC domain-containing protein 2-like [Littorina saxatilis]|uniref:TLC domain-containing protein n=1 Tax=Littorina saxatilis TaxID=31220 RepID=A0AAN9AHX9_9CAEN